jgi:hypothetical protein
MVKEDTSIARIDTARIRQLLHQRPVPTDRWVVRAGTILKPGEKFFVRVRGATNLSGVAADGQAVLTIAVPKEPPARKDSTRATPAGKPR